MNPSYEDFVRTFVEDEDKKKRCGVSAKTYFSLLALGFILIGISSMNRALPRKVTYTTLVAGALILSLVVYLFIYTRRQDSGNSHRKLDEVSDISTESIL